MSLPLRPPSCLRLPRLRTSVFPLLTNRLRRRRMDRQAYVPTSSGPASANRSWSSSSGETPSSHEGALQDDVTETLSRNKRTLQSWQDGWSPRGFQFLNTLNCSENFLYHFEAVFLHHAQDHVFEDPGRTERDQARTTTHGTRAGSRL